MKRTTDFVEMKQNESKIVMLTAYDYPSAKLAEQADVDMILVGDSLGMVVLGYESTIAVTLADMIYHTKAVKRGAKATFVVTDMPFMTYHLSADETLKSAAQIMQQGGADAVKVEGGNEEIVAKIKMLTKAGVPVMGHLGLTPQSVGVLGGYKVQAQNVEAAQQLIEEAKQCEAAGAFAIVLECIPTEIAQEVTKVLSIPTIGIGAGNKTDGQVLVYHDLITYGVDRVPKFVKQYNNINKIIIDSISQYRRDVKDCTFPKEEHSFMLNNEQRQAMFGGNKS